MDQHSIEPSQQYHSSSDSPAYDNYSKQGRIKHSGPGIASFIIAILTIAGFVASFIGISMYIVNLFQHGTITEESLVQTGILGFVLLFFACIILNVVGVILGIVGLVLKKRKKIFAILGTTLNVLILIVLVGLITFGLSQVPGSTEMYSAMSSRSW